MTEESSSYIPNPVELDGCPDMSTLIYLEEENVMHNLKIRFQRQTVYTAISKILISINPYEWLPLYTDQVISKYVQNYSRDTPDPSIEPHCYNIAAIAYDDMNSEAKSQSLVVCGESGSGKTESAKALMSYLAKTKTQGGTERDLCEAVLAVNPILEAFGNAKTIMNNNSSRFGKFTKMIFTDYNKGDKLGTSKLVGSVIKSYLLEKSRVILQNHGERNFHIFFQLFEGLSGEEIYGFKNKAEFYYLTQTGENAKFHQVPGQDDKKNFTEMKSALSKINVNETEIKELFQSVAAILHMGNINFKTNEKDISIDPDTNHHFEKVAQLLELEPEFFGKKLVQKRYKIMNEIVLSPFSLEEAMDNRNAMAKSLYEEIFQWIIGKCNLELMGTSEFEQLRFIGILDVFGFECFLRNSFEQFCINFANERLQQLFSESLMLSEQKEYLREGIAWEALKMPDNRGIMKLINSKPSGIFSQLEAACNMPKGSPEIFVSNVFKENASNKRLTKVKQTKEILASLEEGEKFSGFKIKHYADTVIYNCNKFLSKNADKVSAEVFELYSTSKLSIMKEIFPASDSENGDNKKGSTTNNIGFIFTKELDGLIKTLKKTSNFFVRCVNPNKNKSSTEFDYNHVKNQLRSGGLVQVLKVIKLGYPTRSTYDSLNSLKSKIATHPILEDLKEKEYWNAIFTAFNINEVNYQFGLTKVFFKSNINFIADMKNFDGNLTAGMIDKIRKMFVERRLRIVKGLLISYLRVRDKVEVERIKDLLSVTLVMHSGLNHGLKVVREKIRIELEEQEKERLRQEKLKKEQEEREREIAAQKEKAEQEAMRQEKLLEEKNLRLIEEQMKAQEDQQKKIEEIKLKEKLAQERANEKRKQIEEENNLKMEQMRINLKKQREEEFGTIERKRKEFEEQHDQNKKLKADEISKLEEKIELLKKKAEEILEANEKENEKKLQREKEFEEKVREKIDREREEAMRLILVDSKQKSDAMNDKLSEYEQQKRAEIESLYKENDRRLAEKKIEIDEYEKESRERVKLFGEENIRQFNQMKELSAQSQEKMKIYIEEKMRQVDEESAKLDAKRLQIEKDYMNKVEELDFQKNKSLNEISHHKEMVQIELEHKKKEVENEKANAENLEKIFREQLEELHNKKKADSKKAHSKKGSKKSKMDKSMSKFVEKYNSISKNRFDKLFNINKVFSEGGEIYSKLFNLKIDTNKARYETRRKNSEAEMKNISAEIVKEAEQLKKLNFGSQIGNLIKTFKNQEKMFENASREHFPVENFGKLEAEVSSNREMMKECLNY